VQQGDEHSSLALNKRTAKSSNDDKTFAVYCIIIATGKGVPRKPPSSNHYYYCVCVWKFTGYCTSNIALYVGIPYTYTVAPGNTKP